MSELILVFFVCVIEYFCLCVMPYLVLWVWFPNFFHKWKIQKIPRQVPQLKIEIMYSLVTLPIRTLFFWFVFYKCDAFSSSFNLGHELVAAVGYFAIYDPYFYWTHRLLHWGWLYKRVHVVHHRSINPTPFASFSFHPIESVTGLFYMLPAIFIFHPHSSTFIGLMVLTDIGNLAGHTGYEFLPRLTVSSWWGRWITTPTHHNLHHQFSRYNFGLYWGGWDRIFGTQHAKTDDEFIRVKSGL